MAGLLNGQWVEKLPDPDQSEAGEYNRPSSAYRSAISSDPDAEFVAEPGRYRLWVAWACPWAGRTLAMRALKQLEEIVPISIGHRGEEGWTYDEGPDGEEGPYPLHRLYTLDDPHYTGKVTVPVLWDSRTQRIVNNESADIIRILNSAFNGHTGNYLDLNPDALHEQIDHWNDIIYPGLNNGVYRAGFATAQTAYEAAANGVFETLDLMESHLAQNRYLAGEYCTEADWRAFVSLVRFDIAYHGAFKCNLRRIADYPALSNYLRELYQWPGIAQTIRQDVIKPDYYSIPLANPNGIIPIGPEVDYAALHNRAELEGRGIWDCAAEDSAA
ncbi:glutathione S-transferase family protein [Altericroceibacterium endophyticum]|uniref:Glutathione S-transferase family protein n=1 Tax=Altericroceibacterium endophyticum TaxID=1808508 RepID=A0A6I4TAC5_9SPHN|nr:glutathione S-transferase C-terminal domain-containing protein [Altericroceibacterium endophyticum]MXO66820.1 glutathione S-transferase family protein [Altericroceibacterium endophyticum]